MSVSETPIQQHPEYERVRKAWDDALALCEEQCRGEAEAAKDHLRRWHSALKCLAAAEADRDELLAALKEVGEMFVARPDMLAAIQPLMGWDEKATFHKARIAIARCGRRKACE